MFVRKQNAIQLFWGYTALFEAQNNLARAESAIDQNFTVIGRDQGAVSRAAAAEHSQTEHPSY
jgi:hypothetical protein